MRFTVQYPIAHAGYDCSYLDPESVVRFARAAEEAGFSAIAFTDHPAPSDKWVRTGGHDALDPFAALGFCAAVTRRMLLMTLLLVLPYRNPLLAAKAAATVDVLSGGRLVLGVGSGCVTRTALIDTPAALSTAVAEIRDLAAEVGRDPGAVAVQVESSDSVTWYRDATLERHRHRLGEFADAGATWFVVDPPGDDVERGIDALHRYGAEIIAAHASAARVEEIVR